MAYDVYLEGALFPDVPAVMLPDGNSTFHRFTDTSPTTATASDVAQGKQFFDASGTLTTGTSSGGGGSSWELLASQDFTAETTSTSQTNIGTISCGSGAFVAGDFIYVRVRDKAGKRAGYFYGTDNFYANVNAANGNTSNFSVSAKYTHRVNSAGNYATYASNSAYGVYSLGITSSGNITIAKRYNANNSLTVNGTYAVEVYKLTLANGEKVFD